MKKAVFLLLTIVSISFCFAQTSIKLYAGKAPGSETWNWSEQKAANTQGNALLYNIVEPEILVYPAPEEKANGTSIVVAPGGAFHIISIENEGINVANWLNDRGITAFVLKYRLVKMLTDNPFKELMTLMGDFKKLDSINAPVVEMAKNDGLYKNAVVGNLMPTKSTPIFVAVASDDQLGLMPHSIKLYQEWNAAKQSAELHVYEKGGHGFGIMKHNTSSDQWATDFENWLKVKGFL